MVRPKKEGLDYFPLDTDMDQDDKVIIIIAKYGMQGFGILIKLLMEIYKNGYSYQWTEKEQIIFSSRVNVDINSIKELVNDCIKWGLFNEEIYNEYGVLTSKGIQERFLLATSRRVNVGINEKLKLVSVDINSNSSEKVSAESTQSKRKEIKEKKPSRHKYETCDLEFANLLFSLMRENNETVKQPNLEKWANEFRLMREKDERTVEQIQYMIKWTQKDVFWKTNILSPSKMREQFNQLILRVRAEREKKVNIGTHQKDNGIKYNELDLEGY